MIHSFLSEFVKLNRTAMRYLLLGMAFVGVLGTAFSIFAATGSSSDLPRLGDTLTKAVLSTSEGIGHSLGQIGGLFGALALSAAGSVVGSEYSLGTWKNLFVREPRLSRLLGGKIAALLTYVVVGAVGAALTGTVVSFVMGESRGIDTGNWVSSAGLAAALASLANLSISAIAYASFGTMLAVLFRSPVAAIGGGLAYILPGENILALASDGVRRVLPGQVFSAVAAGGTADIGYWSAVALLAMYVGLFCFVALFVFRKRELGA
jgi:ABC-2 type transport system permease protein